MYKVLIIEDEKPAADWLKQLILKFDSQITVLAVIDSVSGAVEWFQQNQAPDLALMDIQLADGLSFDIFERTKIQCPVIFTTAYEEYKTRFVIKVGEHLKSITVDDILFFYSLEKATYLCTTDFKTYLVDYSLDRIAGMIDEHRFFRINRKYILSNQSIADIIFYSNSRLKIKLKKPDEESIIVSRDKVAAFKEWLDL